jgi:hypothetical protein
MATWEEQTDRGLGYPLGPDAIGQISYDASGPDVGTARATQPSPLRQ